VIHRDIKPENLLLHDGRAMVMDFGIALAVSAAAGGRMTETGLSLGTPHYMSPEQATAEKEITGRSDIYSLASVLYEMLAGEPPHGGGSAQQIIMKIITETPQPVTARRRSVPPNVSATLMRALEKLPADRFATAAEFTAALKDRGYTMPLTGTMAGATGHRGAGSWLRDPRSIAALGLMLVASTFALLRPGQRAGDGPPQPIRFSVPLPNDTNLVNLRARAGSDLSEPVVSPDSRYIAFAATAWDGWRLYVRAIGSTEAREVPGGGYWPFFSADGRALGFFREAEVWRLDLDADQPTRVGVINERPWDILSAVWHPDGRILVTGSLGVWSLPAGGGDAGLLIPADTTTRERLEAISVLPDGRVLLEGSSRDGVRLRVFDADGGRERTVFASLSRVRVVGDVVVYEQSGQTRASRFDARRLALLGEPLGLVLPEDLRIGPSIAWTDASADVPLEPVWVSPSGAVTSLGLPHRAYRWPRVSPSGTRIVARPLAEPRMVIHDLRTGTQVSLDGYTEPVWLPDETAIITSLGNRPGGGLGIQRADASRGLDTLLAITDGDAWPTDVSRDGKWLAWYGATYSEGTALASTDPNDLFVMDLATRESRRIPLAGEQRGARFSPDGRWLAYQSTESGRLGIHVRPFPALDANWVISTDGGEEPLWSADGRTLYYRRSGAVMAVGLTMRGTTLDRAPARELFRGAYLRDHFGDISWDIGRDGRFLMLRPVRGSRQQVEVMLHWIEDVRARLGRATRQGAR
jgi:Tol biopolymer transport system component